MRRIPPIFLAKAPWFTLIGPAEITYPVLSGLRARFWLIGSVLGLRRCAENGKREDALKKKTWMAGKKREMDAEEAGCK